MQRELSTRFEAIERQCRALETRVSALNETQRSQKEGEE